MVSNLRNEPQSRPQSGEERTAVAKTSAQTWPRNSAASVGEASQERSTVVAVAGATRLLVDGDGAESVRLAT